MTTPVRNPLIHRGIGYGHIYVDGSKYEMINKNTKTPIKKLFFQKSPIPEKPGPRMSNKSATQQNFFPDFC